MTAKPVTGKLWRVELLVEADESATKDDVQSLVTDLEWVGGCRDPHDDPMFDSVTIREMEIKPGRRGNGRLQWFDE